MITEAVSDCAADGCMVGKSLRLAGRLLLFNGAGGVLPIVAETNHIESLARSSC
jgi:hypothetical protein